MLSRLDRQNHLTPLKRIYRTSWKIQARYVVTQVPSAQTRKRISHPCTAKKKTVPYLNVVEGEAIADNDIEVDTQPAKLTLLYALEDIGMKTKNSGRGWRQDLFI